MLGGLPQLCPRLSVTVFLCSRRDRDSKEAEVSACLYYGTGRIYSIGKSEELGGYGSSAVSTVSSVLYGRCE